MGRRLLSVGLLVAITLLTAGVGAWAVESGLAGIKIDQSAVDLLKQSGLGEPLFIGPTGVTVGEAAGAKGPNAPAPVAAPAAPVYPINPYGRPTVTPVSPMAPATPLVTLGQLVPQLYWLYPRGGETLVVGIRNDGSVASVQVTGVGGPSRTARGIGLGSPYQRVLSTYGFPDQTINVGSLIVARYQEDGLTFTLASMTVNSILLEANPSVLAAPSAPTPLLLRPVAPPPGMPAPVAPGAPPGQTTGKTNEQRDMEEL
jgi:hypothetical protein